MSDRSRIEWTDTTWNPVTGCDKVSPGCGLPRYEGDEAGGCYAMALAKRLKAMGQAKYQRDGDPRTSGPGFGVTTHPEALPLPLRWRTPRRVFVTSMGDLFHRAVPDEFIAAVFAVMAATPEHTYQVLSKRPGRMRSLLSRGELGTQGFPDLVENAMAAFTHASLDVWPLPNVWLGVSVETQQWADIRIPALLGTPAALRFLSCEPLLGPLPGLGLEGIGWVITGGESGARARPINPQWVREIRDACHHHGVAFFHKQWGGRTPKAGGRELDGRTWDQYPSPSPARPAGAR